MKKLIIFSVFVGILLIFVTIYDNYTSVTEDMDDFRERYKDGWDYGVLFLAILLPLFSFISIIVWIMLQMMLVKELSTNKTKVKELSTNKTKVKE